MSGLGMKCMKTAAFLGLLLSCMCLKEPAGVIASPQDDYFTVAVLEHARVGNWTQQSPADYFRLNLDYYERAAEVAKSKNADIIVFPEYVLLGLGPRDKMRHYLETIPDPKSGRWNPCKQETLFADRPVLRSLSCMAMNNEMYVIANLGDVQPCTSEENTNCPEDGIFIYNANAVFDRQGTLISRYRKEHLFLEIGLDLPPKPQDPTFVTDFGRFASFICFDSVFKHMVDAAHMEGVDGVFLSMMWVDFMPFFQTIQYYQGWAIGNNVTLVASNIQSPKQGSVGSGVFAGRSGAVSFTYNPDGRSKLLVSKAPKTNNRGDLLNLGASITIITSNGTEPYNENDIDFDTYLPEYCAKTQSEVNRSDVGYKCVYEKPENFTFIKLTEPNGNVSVCNNGMCCSLKYSTVSMNESFYLGITNSTYNSYNRYFRTEERCLIVRCEQLDGMECSAYPTISSTVFLDIELKANFTTPYVYPSVMTTGMRPAPTSEWVYDVINKGDHYVGYISFTNSSLTNKMVVAALHGRCYDRDPPYIR